MTEEGGWEGRSMMSQKPSDSREDVTDQLIPGGGEIGCHLMKLLEGRRGFLF